MIVMVTKNNVIKVLRNSLPHLNNEYGVKRIGLFGSIMKGQADDKSDVDVVVEFEKPIGLRFVEFTEYLEQLFGRKTDVLTPAGISGIRDKKIANEIKDTVVYV